MSFQSRAKLPDLILVLGLGGLGALGARHLGLPLPFLLGSLIATATASLTLFARTGRRLWFPQTLRKTFVATIGVMIGTTFAPSLLSSLPGMWRTLLAMVIFVLLAQGLGYLIFRHIGRYDRTTALFAAMPGGLIEAIALGEKAGGDVETLSLQHFARIVLVVIAIPGFFYIWTGEAVGSAAGQTLEKAPPDLLDWLAFAVLVPIGIVLGERLRLPASHLMGPLLLSAVLHGSGALSLTGPTLLLNTAQLVVGAGLGVMFARSTPKRLLIGFALGSVSVGTVLGLGMGMATLLAPHVSMSFEALLISFAPGGITEMSLIALSLGISPVLVAAHHLFRIVLTVTMAGLFFR
jgi:membrane AbrB-like protein